MEETPNPALKELKAPPKPAMAFRVGVVGHRPDRLKAADEPALAVTVKGILSAIKAAVVDFHDANRTLFKDAPAILRAVSPLAEGTDRIFAEQALGLGFELCCPMPFAQKEYEKDFQPEKALEPNSLQRFRRLMERAESETGLTIFELDGDRSNASRAYGACGRVVLNQSDILLVLWDGENLAKAGGTEQIMREAVQQGIATVWIDAQSPHAWRVIQNRHMRSVPLSTGEPPFLHLRGVVESLLDLPQEGSGPSSPAWHLHREPHARKALETFYAERRPLFLMLTSIWRGFRDLFADRKFLQFAFRVQPFEPGVLTSWPQDHSTPVARLVDRLRPFYAWPDKLAVIYGDAYRAAFVATYLLAALAVFFALFTVGLQIFEGHHRHSEAVTILLELLAIVLILLIVNHGRRQRWHERLIDYRLTGELVRHLRLTAPLGGGRSFPQLPAHLSAYGHPAGTWMAWYIRNLERDLGLPEAKMGKAHIRECLGQIIELIEDQMAYHRHNALQCHRIESRLHCSGIGLLCLTLIACALHALPFFPGLSELPLFHKLHGAGPLLVFCSGFFPALGAALAGINNQGEFRRIEKRSRAMIQQLLLLKAEGDGLRQEIDAPNDHATGQLTPAVSALAEKSAKLMVREVLDWRVVFLDRPLTPPA